jgi:hypothetical protein
MQDCGIQSWGGDEVGMPMGDKPPRRWAVNEAQGMQDVAGFDVQALDGMAGRVADVVNDELRGTRCLVVRPGHLHQRHVVPASVVREVNGRQHRIRVGMTKHDITHAPTYRAYEAEQLLRRLGPPDGQDRYDQRERPWLGM